MSAALGMESELFAKLKQVLTIGIECLDIELSEKQISSLLAYLSLLLKWNRAYNLSAVREPVAMVQLHLLDSLVIAPLISGARIIDVGTGAGLPGIPLAIVYPEKSFTLLDSAGKKTRFLLEVKHALALNNTQVENRRVESFRPPLPFDGIISRAFASLGDMTEQCQHLLAEGGAFWAMKGQYPQQELQQMSSRFQLAEHFNLDVPGVDAERCLLKIVATA